MTDNSSDHGSNQGSGEGPNKGSYEQDRTAWEEDRRDQLLTAPKSVESDADPRIEVTTHDGVTRIDIAEDAQVRPGNPYEEPSEPES